MCGFPSRLRDVLTRQVAHELEDVRVPHVEVREHGFERDPEGPHEEAIEGGRGQRGGHDHRRRFASRSMSR